jgi:thioredoxin-related protein
MATLITAPVLARDQRPTAGRVWNKGDVISLELNHLFRGEDSLNTELKALMLVIFTREDQRFSQRLTEDMVKVTEDLNRDSLRIVEVRTPRQAGTPAGATSPTAWDVIWDGEHRLYEAMGVRVFPTIFILSDEGTVLEYLPGYTSNFYLRLTNALNKHLPTLYPLVEAVHYSKSSKSQHRQEKLARKLYDNGQLNLVLKQLDRLDSLSQEGAILKGFTFLELGDYASAKELFLPLLKDSQSVDYARLGLAIVAYYQESFVQALDYVLQIRTLPDMYQVYYWRGRIEEGLGNQEQALEAYRRSAESARRRLTPSLIP